ncbi:transcription termination factor MTERF5, chloroplastic-like [Magnolia sinica]|uniref:transcription termination factor MTERF5, chloroplastic-like n=1 Tax=Magnolia sinica TaxID=86752 RepID=UPI00265ADF78|nr:transcription termination factor MTERF5, chloroplastic-like [Magnolia sinica]
MPVLQHTLLFFKNPRKTLISSSHFIALLSFSTSKTQDPPHKTQDPPHKTPFIVDYLTTSFGFSSEKAISLSTNLTHIKSPRKPDSVVSFFRNCGLSDANIRDLISWRPRFLSSNVERTLLPKVRILQGLGLAGSGLAEVVVSNPRLLVVSAEPVINFVKTLLHSEEDVIKFLKRSKWEFSAATVENKIRPNISILQSCGASSSKIATLLVRNPNFFAQNPRWVKDLTNRIEEMGLPCQNGMFFYAVFTVGSMSKTVLEAKFNLFKSFGWSDVDILSAFAKAPEYVKYSERKSQEAMNYFVKELACEPSYIVRYPKLLSYSLENRIIPRCNVLRILKSKELLNKNPNLYPIVSLSEEKFLKQYVRPYMKIAPDICQAHLGRI